MNFITYIIIIFFIFYSHKVFSITSFIPRLKIHIKQHFLSNANIDTLDIKILTPEKLLKNICDHPTFLAPQETRRLAGQHTAYAQCGTQRYFIRFTFSATGSYWVSGYTLAAGQKILPQHLIKKTGKLDHLSADFLSEPQFIIGKVLIKKIQRGDVFSQKIIQSIPLIEKGKEVMIRLSGYGFNITTRGIALCNADLGESIRIRLKNGKIMTAMVMSPDTVSLSEKM